MRILGPNCLGVFDAAPAYYATFSSSFDSGWPVPGRIGIASQSGAYGTHLYTLARNRGIGASLCVMTGNEADVTVGECIGWLAENPEVDVIAVYAEGIREAAGPDRGAGSGAGGEKADRHAEGRPQRTRQQGGEVAHRLDRRRRCGDRGGDARNSACSARATARRCWISPIPRPGRSIRRRNTLGVITVSGGAGVLISDVAESSGWRCRKCRSSAQTEAARPGAVLCAAQSGGCDGAGSERCDAGQDVHRIDGARRRLRLGAGRSSA